MPNKITKNKRTTHNTKKKTIKKIIKKIIKKTKLKLTHATQQVKLLENAKNTKLLVMRNRNETHTASIFFFFKVGSKNETPDVQGISHFIEHMVFKGSPKYPSYLDISKTFDANGISFNAFTSKDTTAYHYKFLASKENMDIICSITSDMIFNPLMRDKDINTERNVIIQELKDDEDDIDEWISDKIEELTLEGHPLAKPIIGNLKTLNAITRKELLEYHQRFYKPDNLVIALSGNINIEFIHLINKYFSNDNDIFKEKTTVGVTKSMGSFIPYLDKNIHLNIDCFPKNLQQDYVYIIFKTRGVFDPNINHYKLIANILGGNMSSRLFVRIREKLGLVYSVKCSITNYEEVGYFVISTQNENKTTIECLRNIIIELNKFKKHGVDEKELAENKKNYTDTFITNFDDIEYENEYYARQMLFNLPLEPVQKRINKINSINTIEIQNVANELFNFSRMHIITFGKVKQYEIKKIKKIIDV
jgi:predicted Zn-dependent peptidase